MDLMVHQGLGDMIICNGLIRNLCEEYNYINLIVAKNNEISVKSMFKDIKNLNLIIWCWGKDAKTSIKQVSVDEPIKFEGYFTEENSNFYKWYNETPNADKYIHKKGFINAYCPFIGPTNKEVIRVTNINDSSMDFDVNFYDSLNIPFDYRWSKFKINRDISKEKELFKHFNIEENNYCFLHDDVSRGLKINIDTDLKIIKPELGLTDNILDYCYIIENAKEVHCMDSSFKSLADSLNLDNKLYLYTIRTKNVSKSKHNWILK